MIIIYYQNANDITVFQDILIIRMMHSQYIKKKKNYVLKKQQMSTKIKYLKNFMMLCTYIKQRLQIERKHYVHYRNARGP